MAQSVAISTTLATSIALIDQFVASLDVASNSTPQPQPKSIDHPSPLHLLTASVTSLKSAVTKASLLTITAPFTPSAISSVVQPLNTSVLPSLVTATLLTSTGIYPESFAKECVSLARSCLRNLKILLFLVKSRSEDGQPKREVSELDKQNVTEATGRIWEDCDLLLQFSKDDVTGFVFKKAGQWLDLMKDAVEEFKEWDPEEDVGDDPFGLNETQSDDEDDDTKQGDSDRATMSAGVKDQALKVLSRIPQSVHVVVKQRLAKLPRESSTDPKAPMTPMPAARRKVLEKILTETRKISECIDESAEAMYMGDPERCLKKAGEARALTIDVVLSVLEPWEKTDQETKEDQYIKRALAWIRQVETGNATVKSNTVNAGKEKP